MDPHCDIEVKCECVFSYLGMFDVIPWRSLCFVSGLAGNERSNFVSDNSKRLVWFVLFCCVMVLFVFVFKIEIWLVTFSVSGYARSFSSTSTVTDISKNLFCCQLGMYLIARHFCCPYIHQSVEALKLWHAVSSDVTIKNRRWAYVVRPEHTCQPKTVYFKANLMRRSDPRRAH